jgi:hypothetical protein
VAKNRAAKSAKAKPGRPSSYSAALADKICDRIASGESLLSICKADNVPSQSMVFRWLNQHAAFREKYARARDAQADVLAEETLEIADDGSNDWIFRNDPDNPGYLLNGEHVQRSKLRIDARKWFASKVAPKKYGDKVQLAGDAENPLTVVGRIERVIIGTDTKT